MDVLLMPSMTMSASREDIILECVHRFATVMTEIFGLVYLRAPTDKDTERLLEKSKERGWPCMLGSIDCMH